MSVIDTIKKNIEINKDNIYSYIVIILLFVGIIALYRYSKKVNSNKLDNNKIIKQEINQNSIIKSNTIDFSGNFGIHINKESDKINISEYMNNENELISENKKYKVKFVNGMIYLFNNVSGKTIRSLDSNVSYQFYKKDKYSYTENDKKIINNGLIFITKNQINDTGYTIKLVILNKDGKIFETVQIGNEKSNAYLKLDDCGNLILYVDDKEKIDIFNLVEL